jgi:hypothetical protein
MNITTPLYTREGTEPVDPARVRFSDAGKPFVVVTVKCCRCGGSGIYTKHHGACYRCGGHGRTPADTWDEKLYTADQLAKLNATAEKRAESKRAKTAAALDAARAQFETAHADLLALVPASWLDGTALRDTKGYTRPDAPREAHAVEDIVHKGRRFGSISEKLAELVRTLVARYAERQAAQAQRAATSKHVGRVSERLTVDVVCVRHATYERVDRFRFHAGTETVHICQFEDGAGNVLVTKSPRFSVEQGARGTLTGTVTQHDLYRDVKQTVLQRATFAPVVAVDGQSLDNPSEATQ